MTMEHAALDANAETFETGATGTASRTVRDASAAADDAAPRAPLAAVLHAAAVRCPGKPAVAVGDRSLSYAEVDLEARRLAQRLVASGVRPGDRVAVHMYRGFGLANAYLAC